MSARTVQILLADDHDVVRKGLRTMLETRKDWHVCGEATTGNEAVLLATRLRPDIAVLDLEMAELDGIRATQEIKSAQPEIEVLIFTMHDSGYLIREALAAGARAFVLKSEGGRKLVEAIEAVIQHKPYFVQRVSETLLNSSLKSGSPKGPKFILTQREREVVQLLANGKSNKESAAALGISVKTVETHRSAIMRKLQINSVAQLVRFAVRERIVKA
jgi:DNA-binding NarL/FixJ family response regulator